MSLTASYLYLRFIRNPLLYRNKKFHFRCYAILTGAMEALLYRKSFILSAGLDFNPESTEINQQITNLSINKKFAGHPGQVSCDMPVEYPEVRLLFFALDYCLNSSHVELYLFVSTNDSMLLSVYDVLDPITVVSVHPRALAIRLRG